MIDKPILENSFMAEMERMERERRKRESVLYIHCDTVTIAEDLMRSMKRFKIKEAIFNNPATIVYWKDGTKTVVTDTDNMVNGKAKPAESYSKETGLALCFMKKALGNRGNYNNTFREWIKNDK